MVTVRTAIKTGNPLLFQGAVSDQVGTNTHDPTVPAYNEDGVLDLVRSVIFVAGDEQRTAADLALAAVAAPGQFGKPVNTVVDNVGHFHRAREDQQRYLEKNGEAVCSLKQQTAEAAE